MNTVSERHAAVLFNVAMYATEKKLERHEINNCVQAALNSFDNGVSPATAVEIGKQSVAAYSAEMIIKKEKHYES